MPTDDVGSAWIVICVTGYMKTIPRIGQSSTRIGADSAIMVTGYAGADSRTTGGTDRLNQLKDAFAKARSTGRRENRGCKICAPAGQLGD